MKAPVNSTKPLIGVALLRLVRLCSVDRGGFINGLSQMLTGWAIVRVKDLRLIMGNQCSCRSKMEGWKDGANRASAIQSLSDAHTVAGQTLRECETSDLQLESRLQFFFDWEANRLRQDLDAQTPTTRHETQNHEDKRSHQGQTCSECGEARKPERPSASACESESSRRSSPGETREMDSSFLSNV
jgi:hypothetical protein